MTSIHTHCTSKVRKALPTLFLTLLSFAAISGTAPEQAQAQWLVTDLPVLAEETASLLLQGTEHAQQVEEYIRQGQQLKAQLDNLKDLDFSSLSGLQNSMKALGDLFSTLGSLSDSWGYLSNNWDDIYGESATSSFRGPDFDAKHALWLKLSNESMRDAVKSSSQTLDALGTLSDKFKALEEKNQATKGSLQAQKTNTQANLVLGRQQQLATQQTVRDSQWKRTQAMQRRAIQKTDRKRQMHLLGAGMGEHKTQVGAVVLIEF